MAHQDVETMRRAYELANQGDIPGMLAATMDDQVEWHEFGGGNAPAGVFHGVERVASAVFGPVPAAFEEYRAEPDRFIRDAAGHVVVVGTFRGRGKEGRRLDAPFVHVWELRDGKVVRMRNHVDADAWREAWGG